MKFPTVAVGAIPVLLFHLGVLDALIAIAVANLIGAAIIGVISTYGPVFGVPQMIHSRGPFGYSGNIFPVSMSAITGFSWFAINTVLATEATVLVLGINFYVAAVSIVVVQMLVAVFGYKTISHFQKYSSLLMSLLFAVLTAYFFIAPSHQIYVGKVSTMGTDWAMVATASIAFSMIMSWMPCASDYTRYLPTKTPRGSVFLSVFSSTALSTIWLESIGALISTSYHILTPINLLSMVFPGQLIAISMVVLIMGTVATNSMNVYSTSLSMMIAGIPIKRWVSAMIAAVAGGAIVVIIGKSNMISSMESLLTMMGVWISPWLAIVLVDFFLVAKTDRDDNRFRTKSGFRYGFIAWAVGVATSLLFVNASIGGARFVGVVAMLYPYLSPFVYPVGFLFAGVVSVLLGTRHMARNR